MFADRAQQVLHLAKDLFARSLGVAATPGVGHCHAQLVHLPRKALWLFRHAVAQSRP
jgi:hypothetical protein